jgi:hypothetical protein
VDSALSSGRLLQITEDRTSGVVVPGTFSTVNECASFNQPDFRKRGMRIRKVTIIDDAVIVMVDGG